MDAVLIRLVVAAVLAGLIGIDRELRSKPAGLRTNIVVAVAAAAFAYVGSEVFSGGDPTRVASQVVSGIGFLGGGAIFASGGRPRGLTTAAALWGSAAIGIAAGTATYGVGVAIVVVTLLALWPLDWLADRLIDRFGNRDARLHVVLRDLDRLEDIRNTLAQHDIAVLDLELGPIHDHVQLELLVTGGADRLDEVVDLLREMDGVASLSDVPSAGQTG